MKYTIVQTTIDDEEKALYLAEKAVNEKLAACVHITEIKSVYQWQGKFENVKEYLLQMKTLAEKQEELMDFVKNNHSYDLPELVFLPVEGGAKEYLNWIREELT